MVNNCEFEDDCGRCSPVKLYVNKLIRQVNSLRVKSNEPPANATNFRGDSNNMVTKMRSNTGDMRREVDRFKNDLNDMQGILNVVSELVQCTANGNVPNDTINFLRTLSTSIMKNTKDAINTACKPVSVSDNGETAKIARTERGVKRGRDVDERVTVEHNTTKKPKKTQDNCEMSTDNVNNSFVPRNTPAVVENENDNKPRESCEPTNAGNSVVTSDVDRKHEFSKIVVRELDPYYANDCFETIDLFRFAAKTIVHRLVDSDICPEGHIVKMTLRQIMPETKIRSKNQVLETLKPFLYFFVINNMQFT